MLKAFKYRLYPNKEQQIQLAKTFGCVRFIYNYYLAMKIDLYKSEQKSMSKIDCNNHLNQFLKRQEEYNWLKEVDKFALTNAIYNLDSAYQNFFRRIKQGETPGFPKFKSKKDNYKSYTTNFTNNNVAVDFNNNKIKLPKLKWIKCKLHRNFDGQIKSATISQTPSGKYFVSVLVETEIEQKSQNNNVIAFDLGLKELLIDDTGNKIDNPKILYKYEKKLAKEQRKLTKKQKNSNNRNKQRIKVAKIHEKIVNIRKNFLHNVSSQIINENQVIICEKLNVKNMVQNHQLSKAISNVSWNEFTKQLQYKSNWYGRVFHQIDTWFASSQICSDCGYKNSEVKDLSIRQWQCPNCGEIHDRDVNAARNIKQRGLRELNVA